MCKSPRALLLITVALLLVAPGAAFGQRIFLEDFDDDPASSPPDPPAIGSYFQISGSHEVLDVGAGNHVLKSTDAEDDNGFLLGCAFASPVPVATVEYTMRVESGVSLLGSSGLQQTVEGQVSKSIVLGWGEDFQLRSLVNGGDPVATGFFFAVETDYHVRWIVDTDADTYSIAIDGLPIVDDEPLGDDFTTVRRFGFFSSFTTVGRQRVDDVAAWAGSLVFADDFENGDHFAWSAPLPDPGDECVSAWAITDGTFLGDLSDNTGADDDSSICGFQDHRDEWWAYTTSCSGMLTVSTCDSGFDTVLAIYEGCRNGDVFCNDDAAACGLQSQIERPVSAGRKVYIRVSAYEDQLLGGDYRLEVSCTPW